MESKLQKIIRLAKTHSKFFDLQAAISFANHSLKPMAVVMGDCPEYWVVTWGEAQILEKVGYEIAHYAIRRRA